MSLSTLLEETHRSGVAIRVLRATERLYKGQRCVVRLQA